MSSKVKEFFWIEDNGVECGGPYPSIQEAKDAAVRAAKSVNDHFVVSIAKTVARGEIKSTWKWKDKK